MRKNLLPVLDTDYSVKCRGCAYTRGFGASEHGAYMSARRHWQSFPHHVIDVVASVRVYTYEQPAEQQTLDDVPPF